jgi:hypothetical protein
MAGETCRWDRKAGNVVLIFRCMHVYMYACVYHVWGYEERERGLVLPTMIITIIKIHFEYNNVTMCACTM